MHSHLLRQIAIALLLSAIFAISACKPRTTARPSATDPTGTEAPVTAKQPDSSSAPVPTATANSTKVAVDINVGLTAHPLPARAATTGKRFDELPIETTGISFAANWTPPENYGVEIYKTLPGGSVCVGDYDNDGRPDIYLNQPDIGSQLYRNLGNLRFEDVTEATVGNHPHGLGASFVDIDNDGDLDLYVCNNEHPNQLFINEGNSNFVERAKAYGLDFSGSSIMMSFCDYDRDGDLDAFLVTNRKEPKSPIPDPKPGPDGIYRMPPEHREYKDVIIPKDGNARIVMAAQFDHLYRNNGNGTFSEVSREAGLDGGYFGLSSSWWDYNHDGWPDLYVANDFYGPDQLYRNNGDGTFTDVAPQALPHTPWFSMGCDIADINNDGWMDLIGSDMAAATHYRQKASMGNMSDNAWFLQHPTPRQYPRNAMYLNSGTGRFLEIAQLAHVANTEWTWSLKFADLDEDGWADLYVTNGSYRDWTNTDLRNRVEKVKSKAERLKIWLESPEQNDANIAMRNTRDLRFERVGEDWGLRAERVSSGAAMTDLDGDGDLDVVVNNGKKAASVYRNNTADSHRVVVRLKGTKSNRWGIGATVTLHSTTADGTPVQQMRQLNTAQGYMSANEPIVHFGVGDSEYLDRLTVSWPSGIRQSFENLAADRLYVVTETDTPASQETESTAPEQLFESLVLPSLPHRETYFDDFQRQPLLPNQLSQLGPGTACGDVDGDGDLDLFIGGAAGAPGQLLINELDGFYQQFGCAWASEADLEDMGALFLDVDGDRDLDLYVASGGVECDPGDRKLRDRLYINDGMGMFSQADPGQLPEAYNSGSVVNAADFDHDGDLDLFVGGRVIPGQYPLTPQSQLLQNDNGRFLDVTTSIAPGLQETGLVTGAVWSDVDNDGWVDLVVTHEWGPVKLYRNNEGRLEDQTAAAGLGGKTGWFNSIAGGDFDNDGDMDFVVGNFGYNMKYHASDEQPTLLYYGDFERTGRMRLVEAEFENETLFPVRGKSCSTNAMPFLGGKFQKFHEFAVASLQDIYTPQCLETSHRYAANTLASAILLNDGTGKFSFHELPVIAQAAPVFGIVVGHFNNDANLDVIFAQNFFGPQLETGHADGGIGLLMTGNGDGTFQAVPAHESGISIPGDGTSTILADLNGNGSPEVIMAMNDGPVRLLRATRDNGAHTLRLVGKGSNHQATGARVQAIYSDGSSRFAEVTSGSGYLSQSDPAISFAAIEAAQLERVEVRWPNGEMSNSTIQPGDRGTVLVQP